MAKIKTDDQHYIDISNTIKEKLGTTEGYYPREMADGVDAVYEQGKKDERNYFWDSFLAKLGSTAASEMFAGIGWNDNTFYPNKNINAGKNAVNGMFSRSRITNLEERFNSLGITLNTSRATKADNMFYYCNQTEVIPVIDVSGVVETSSLTQMFYSCSKLQTIRKLILPENMTSTNCYNYMFDNCSSLANIEVEGNIVQTISFSKSPLTVESLKSIITHLKDFTDTSNASKYTVTFKRYDSNTGYTAFEDLEDEGATAEYNGQPCTWSELIAYKKWNLG
jgi:hypothetical protein